MNYMINVLNREFYITFVDFKQFFDSTYHEWIYYALRCKNVSDETINEIKNIYNYLMVKMKGMNHQFSGKIPVQRGLLQGLTLSPYSNVIQLDVQYESINKENKLQIDVIMDWWLKWLFYADDLADMASKLEYSQKSILELRETSSIAGNMINIKKTKLMKCMKTLKIKTNEIQIQQYIENNKHIMHQCMKCDGLFPTKVGLITHQKLWCKYNFLCKKCGKILKNKQGLIIHIRIWCGKTIKSMNDITLWSNMSHEEQLETIKYDKKRYGQKIHKIMNKEIEKDMISKLDSIYLDEKRIEIIPTFNYVGSLLRYDGDNEPEIRRRIAIAKQALFGLRNLLRSKRIILTFKIRLIKTYIFSTLFYNCEGWLISPKMCRKIELFGNTCASYMYNTEISVEIERNKCGESFIMFMIRRRWNYLRHCILASEERNIYKTLLKGRELNYSVWTGIKDNFLTLKNISINENRWNREFEKRRKQLYNAYLNLEINHG